MKKDWNNVVNFNNKFFLTKKEYTGINHEFEMQGHHDYVHYCNAYFILKYTDYITDFKNFKNPHPGISDQDAYLDEKCFNLREGFEDYYDHENVYMVEINGIKIFTYKYHIEKFENDKFLKKIEPYIIMQKITEE